MTDQEIQNLKFDYLWTKMIQFNNRMDRLEGVDDASPLTPKQFIALSQAFRKGLEDAD
jgi:hypothetical protein